MEDEIAELFIETPLKTDQQVLYKKLKRNLLLQVCALFAGTFCSFASFKAVLSLQSTVNIKNSIAMLFCLFFTPTILKLIGAKKGLITCEIGYCVFIISNFLPIVPVVVVGSVIAGVAEAIIWPSLSQLCVRLAVEYSQVTGRPKEIYLGRLFGQFYSVVFGTMFLGNMISHEFFIHFQAPLPANSTTEENHLLNYSKNKCGAKNCHVEEGVAGGIGKYVPAERAVIYWILLVFVAMCLSSILVHLKFLQNKNMKNGESNSIQTIDVANKKADLKHKILRNVLETFDGAVKQVSSGVQVLLLPIYLFAGIKMGFMISEYTQAFVACTAGLQYVGLSVALFGAGGCATSLLCQMISNRKSKNICVLCIVLFDVAFFASILKIDMFSSWLLCVLSLYQGLSLGVALPITNKMCAEYFSRDSSEVAFSLWNVCIVVGIMIEFASIPFGCVEQKLIAHIIFTVFAAVCYYLADVLHLVQRKKRSRLSAKL